jgi:anti-sigma B factor antagonist
VIVNLKSAESPFVLSSIFKEETPTKIIAREVEGITIVDVIGRIVLGEGEALLRETITGLIANGRRKFLLNMAGVPYMDSSGLGALVETYHNVHRVGGRLQLLKLTKKLLELLEMTRLNKILELTDNEVEAVRTLRNLDAPVLRSVSLAS